MSFKKIQDISLVGDFKELKYACPIYTIDNNNIKVSCTLSNNDILRFSFYSSENTIPREVIRSIKEKPSVFVFINIITKIEGFLYCIINDYFEIQKRTIYSPAVYYKKNSQDEWVISNNTDYTLQYCEQYVGYYTFVDQNIYHDKEDPWTKNTVKLVKTV